MKPALVLILMLASVTSFAAKDVVDTKLHLSCPISAAFAPGGKDTTEDMDITIKRVNFNDKDPSKPPAWGSITNIKLAVEKATAEASLLRSTAEELAFAYATQPGPGQKTLLMVYELQLSGLKLKRSAITLFAGNSQQTMTAEASCKKL